MTESAARAIAKSAHDGQHTSAGGPQFDHVYRVAAAVPDHARVTAWLHDILERTGLTIDQLRAQGMSPAELSALALLTRTEDEDYRAYVQRIADAPGQAGSLARVVKLADLEDHPSRTPARRLPISALRMGSAHDPARSRRRVRFSGKSRLRHLKRLPAVMLEKLSYRSPRAVELRYGLDGRGLLHARWRRAHVQAFHADGAMHRRPRSLMIQRRNHSAVESGGRGRKGRRT